MSKAIQRPELINKLAEAKRRLAAAQEEFDQLQAELIANMKSSGVKTDETEICQVALVIRMIPDTEECKKIPEWNRLKMEEKKLAEQRKVIEKDHLKEGKPYIRLTFK